MNFRLRSFPLFLPLCALLACGSSGSSNVSAAPTLLTGDYILTLSPGISGAFQISGDIVAGNGVNAVVATFMYDNPQNSTCGAQLINLTGTLNNNSNVLTLKSSAFAGSTATFTVQLPLVTNSSGTTLGSGTAAISGGSCALASTTLQAQFISDFSGIWTGSVGTTAVSLIFAESSAPNLSGQFPVTVTGIFPGCNSTAASTLSGFVTGTSIQASTNTISFSASPGANSNSLNAFFTCGSTSNPIALSH